MGYDATSLAHLYLESFSHSSLQILSSSVRLMGIVAEQLFSGLSSDVRLCWALAGLLNDIQRLVPKPLLSCLGCVLSVVVLSEGSPSPQFEVLSPLEQVFINDVLCSFICPLILISLPVPVAENNSPQRDAATTMLHCSDGARFLQT